MQPCIIFSFRRDERDYVLFTETYVIFKKYCSPYKGIFNKHKSAETKPLKIISQ